MSIVLIACRRVSCFLGNALKWENNNSRERPQGHPVDREHTLPNTLNETLSNTLNSTVCMMHILTITINIWLQLKRGY